MIKKLVKITFYIFLFTACSKNNDLNISDSQLAKIKEPVINYVEGWYNADGIQMEKSLHPDLIKRRSLEGNIIEIYSEEMINLTKGRNKISENDRKYKIIVYDVFNQMACVKLISNSYVDYLQLAKFDNDWKIINVLWDLK